MNDREQADSALAAAEPVNRAWSRPVRVRGVAASAAVFTKRRTGDVQMTAIEQVSSAETWLARSHLLLGIDHPLP
jgi:hypothetical protein